MQVTVAGATVRLHRWPAKCGKTENANMPEAVRNQPADRGGRRSPARCSLSVSARVSLPEERRRRS